MPIELVLPEPPAAASEPEWLASARTDAATRFAAAEWPDTSAEEWRYSRVGDLDVAAYQLPASPGTATREPELGASAGRVHVVDGHLVAVELDEAIAAKGVRLGRLGDLDAAPVAPSTTADADAAEADADEDAFGLLNAAAGIDPLVLDVPAGVVVGAPIHVVTTVTTDRALVLPRLVVSAGNDSEVTVVEWLTSTAVDALIVPRTRLQVGRAARVALVSVNDLATTATQLAAAHAVVEQEATLRFVHAALGGAYARQRVDCRLAGRGSTGELSALYLGDGDQMHDLRTFQTHDARDTTSDLLFKGALDDRAHAVYTGMIRVDATGAGTNANQTNRVIKLSDDAWAESVPNLEIEHSDVRCSHATAVGPIDPDQRFYLESRGVEPAVAERLVVNGFFEEVLERCPVTEVADLVRARLAERLGAAS